MYWFIQLGSSGDVTKGPKKGLKNISKFLNKFIFFFLLPKCLNCTLYLSVIPFLKPLGIYFTQMKENMVYCHWPMRNDILKMIFLFKTFWYIGVLQYFFLQKCRVGTKPKWIPKQKLWNGTCKPFFIDFFLKKQNPNKIINGKKCSNLRKNSS